MIYYELVKVMINASGQVEVIINMVIRHYGIFKSIVTDQSLLFILKFWSLLCYFLGIQRRLFIDFPLQIDDQTKR